MTSINLRYYLNKILTNDISNIVINYVFISCNNCSQIGVVISRRYKKCDGWLCKKCDKNLNYQTFEIFYSN